MGDHFSGTEIDKRFGSTGQQSDTLERRVPHHGHHDVQLELTAGGAADRECLIVAHHSRCQLHHAFAHHWVDLAGHDRTARLASR